MRTGLWLRVFVAFLIAVLPPILFVVAALLLNESVLRDVDPNLIAILVVVAAIAWAAILAVVFTGGLADEFRTFLSLAEHGDNDPDSDLGAAHRQLAISLGERDRQVSTLAQQAARVPIDEDPRSVVVALVSAVRSVMRDPTWRCAVMKSTESTLLRPGTYGGIEDDGEPDPIGELERWASVSDADLPVRHVEGPWGAFAIVDLAITQQVVAILFAPWEGRPSPTPAEVALLTLVGQHAGTALEHSLLYSKVRSQADELNRLAAVQADFLRGVTHDLQTPLTSIGALAAELRANEEIPAGARSDLESITHQADRLRRMVAQLLVASRLEAGVLTPQQEVFAVRPLIERTWSALRASRPFEIRVDGDEHLAVADPDRLEQVLWAVLDNAVKYSTADAPVSVEIGARDGRMAVTVRDHGMGMDDITRARAFDQFYRSEHARRLAPDGSGVGLYAASGLMHAMGGDIEVDSAVGRGSAVTLLVPAERRGEAAD
ncbi:MAG TPA: HAMP domain-containing sensor histidine kinase [Candidatus Limnocylindria bacterium]|nr:HAMP domain-containing sensor histidine kinase [Candidatus Limnocylindria bacterium]